jgi:hypothetical protein
MKELKYNNNGSNVIFCQLVLLFLVLVTFLGASEIVSFPICYLFNNNKDFNFKTGCRVGCVLNNVNKCKCLNAVEFPKCVGGSDIVIGSLVSLLIFTVGLIVIYGLMTPILNRCQSYHSSKSHHGSKSDTYNESFDSNEDDCPETIFWY